MTGRRYADLTILERARVTRCAFDLARYWQRGYWTSRCRPGITIDMSVGDAGRRYWTALFRLEQYIAGMR